MKTLRIICLLYTSEMNKGGKRSRDRFIFVANKVDALDPERGEDLHAILEKDARYLSAVSYTHLDVYKRQVVQRRALRPPGAFSEKMGVPVNPNRW